MLLIQRTDFSSVINKVRSDLCVPGQSIMSIVWSAVEEGLNQDMGILADYLRKWRLQLSMGKTLAAAYHLCNKEAKRELSVSVDNHHLEHQQAPKYLGVRLDRTLSYKQHLEDVRAKITSRVSLIRRLAGTTWGASARTLRISTQALVFSAAEYCAPVWSRSPHVKKVDPVINNSPRIITGCLKSTPVPYLPVLAGIAPASVRRGKPTNMTDISCTKQQLRQCPQAG